MTLESTLRARLAELPALDGRQALSLTQGAWSVALTLDSHDRHSCLLWDVSVRRDAPLPGTMADWAKRLEGVRGLSEPLVLVEIDAGRGEAFLRSDEPTPREAGAVQYYELRLFGTERAVLQRWQGHREPKPRQAVGFALTHEGLARLLGDLTADK